RPLDAVGRGRAPLIIDADDRNAVRLHAPDQPLLHGGVVRERSVAVEMVFGDVEKNPDRGIERGREIDLVGRALDHVRASVIRRRQREDRGADVAADLSVAAGRAQEMRDLRRSRRLAVGAGDGDERRFRCTRAPLAAEQFDVADHLDGGGAGEGGGGGVGGTRGGSRSAEILDQSTCRRSAVGMPALVALTTASALSSQPMTSAPPASSALALASPDPPRPKMAIFFPAKAVTAIITAA